MLRTSRPPLTADQLAEVLGSRCRRPGAPGKDPEYGYGRLNLLRTVQIAADPNVLSHSRIQGVVAGAQAGPLTLTLSTGQQTQADANGAYHFDNLPAGAYTVSVSGLSAASAHSRPGCGTLLSVASLNFSAGPDAAEVLRARVASPTWRDLLPQTGHTLRGDFFRTGANGGLPIFGYPTSEEFVERGEDGHDYTVQCFERHRLELHPENKRPYNVLLSRLGDSSLQQSGRSWFDFPKSAPWPGCQFCRYGPHLRAVSKLLAHPRPGLDGKKVRPAESLALFGQPL